MTKNRRFEIRGETRLKNAKLVRAREEVCMSQKQFAEHVGIQYGTLNSYENLRAYPTAKHRKILSSFCNCPETELFPEELKQYAEGEEPRVLIQVAEVEPSRLLGSVRREALLVSGPSTPESDLDEVSLREEILHALETLRRERPKKDRGSVEAQILELYFGLGDGEPLTLEEIGLRLNLTRERVRQRKESALSFLRGRRISHRLELFFDGIEGVGHDVRSTQPFFVEMTEHGKAGLEELRRRREQKLA